MPTLAASALLLASLQTSPAAAAATSSDGAKLDLLTLNTWGLPAPIARNRTGRFPRIRRFLDGASPDITGLQEVWRGARSLLKMEGLRFPIGRRDSGLAMLSQLPVLDTVSRHFEAASGFDRFKQKGAMLATFDHPDAGVVHVLTTHLQAGRSAGARSSRASQVDELLAMTRDLDGPTVLMGDFNLYDELSVDIASHDRLLAAGFVDAANHVGNDTPTYRGGESRLDRVYVRGGIPLSAVVLPAEGLSDHHPVRVVVELPVGG